MYFPLRKYIRDPRAASRARPAPARAGRDAAAESTFAAFGAEVDGGQCPRTRTHSRGRIVLDLPGLLYCADLECQPGRVGPRIRYCATPAGRVAYLTSGAGPPLLLDSGWVSHLRVHGELFSFASVIERLAEKFTVIRYDKPGCGLSDREGIDLSFDGQVAAALAVADTPGPRSRRG
jgi:hypothetical protein